MDVKILLKIWLSKANAQFFLSSHVMQMNCPGRDIKGCTADENNLNQFKPLATVHNITDRWTHNP